MPANCSTYFKNSLVWANSPQTNYRRFAPNGASVGHINLDNITNGHGNKVGRNGHWLVPPIDFHAFVCTAASVFGKA
jgi:hypothetical protein